MSIVYFFGYVFCGYLTAILVAWLDYRGMPRYPTFDIAPWREDDDLFLKYGGAAMLGLIALVWPVSIATVAVAACVSYVGKTIGAALCFWNLITFGLVRWLCRNRIP